MERIRPVTLWQTPQPHQVCGRLGMPSFGCSINLTSDHAEPKRSHPGRWHT